MSLVAVNIHIETKQHNRGLNRVLLWSVFLMFETEFECKLSKYYVRYQTYKYVLGVIVTFAFFILGLEKLRPRQLPYSSSSFYGSDSPFQLYGIVLNGESLWVVYKDDYP
jgi:hypothetical protein